MRTIAAVDRRRRARPSALVGLALLAPALAGCLATLDGAPTPAPRSKARPANAAPAQGSYEGPDKSITKHNLLANATFNDGTILPWNASFTAPADGRALAVDKAACLEVKNGGQNPWDAQLRHREMVIEKGRRYTISFKAWASHPTKVRAKVGMQGPPYGEDWVSNLKLDTTPRVFTGTFTKTGTTDSTAELAFHVGGSLAYKVPQPFTVCLDDVVLEDKRFVRKESGPAQAVGAVLVNQVGYLPGQMKIATVRSDARAPLDWKLTRDSGAVVASGKTQPVGRDAPSGDDVHVVDFSSFNEEGTGYRIAVGADASVPFDISRDLYRTIKYDALAFFYQNRSGIEIKPAFVARKEWARPAGHLGDRSVPCAPGSGCGYRLDVSGGWYDAGDHGKYVVNGGISVWTLLNQHERAKLFGSPRALADFADKKMKIPEAGNGIPDLLDEVRWQLEFQLKMQVPDGEALAGMVHHKIHDKAWTALGLAPHEDPQPRFLQPPSTAATLNLAANGAQCARIWKKLDPAFSARCLSGAVKAWQAALANPKRFARPGGEGGGPYDDDQVDDEFYWAAAELFITTGGDAYRAFLTKSPWYKKLAPRAGKGGEGNTPTPMTWANVSALGTLSLALVPNDLGAKEVADCRKAVVEAADSYVQVWKSRGYRVPIDYGPSNIAPWGSNSFLLNNLIVLGLAHDLVGRREHLDALVSGIDYIFGRNALGQSYVTGYGDRPLQNPHHRFWAHQASRKFPKAPPGIVSGGPNSNLQDPYVQAAGLKGCAPERCFLDHIEAWSTNEITINWNAPFAWAMAFLDDKAPGSKAENKKR